MVLVLGVGRCAFRPPRDVFVLGLASLINSLTSEKKNTFAKEKENISRNVMGGGPART